MACYGQRRGGMAEFRIGSARKGRCRLKAGLLNASAGEVKERAEPVKDAMVRQG